MNTQTIPLWLAILININIVIGGAFFLNVPLIAAHCGSLAPLVWLGVGALLAPLVFVLAQLAIAYPVAGGLYVYGEQLLGRVWGFISCWGYFIGTAAGNAVILKAFAQQAQYLGIFCSVPSFTAILLFSAIFALLSAYNIELLGYLQTLFTTLKAIPFVLVGIGAWYYFSAHNIVTPTIAHMHGSIASIPLVLFAYIGIEACCAIAHLIDKSKQNTSRAIIISFCCIVAIYSITQFLLVGIFDVVPANPFTVLASLLAGTNVWATVLRKTVEIALLSSYLGGFYSMFYANNWNLYTIAHEHNIPFPQILTRKNAYKSPWVCIVVQTLIILGMLYLSSNTAVIQTMCDFGIVIAYILSAMAFLAQYKKRSNMQRTAGLLALGSCSYLLILCTNNLIHDGIHCAAPFFGAIALGLIGYAFMATRRARPLAP